MAASTLNRGAAFKAERDELMAFLSGLEPGEWQVDSLAEGWRIQDIVAHMGAGCHAIFSPAMAIRMMQADQIERANDMMVDDRRHWAPEQVFAEYRRWSQIFGSVFSVLGKTPVGGLQATFAELGRFPARLLLSALVFDQHTHLRHDIAPALRRPAPGTDANRLAVVLEWMTAVLSNQLRARTESVLQGPLALTLTGPGGGTWRIEPDGRVVPGPAGSTAAQITGVALEFPEWGTARVSWRERDVHLDGDTEYASQFLDTLNII